MTIKKRRVMRNSAAAAYSSAPAATPLAAAEAATAYQADPQTRIGIIRRGVPAATVTRLSERMGLSKELMLASLGLSRATISRKEKEAAMLSKDETERLLGFETLIEAVEEMVAESAPPGAFDGAHWLARWLANPLPALGGATPASYMDTFEGQRLVGSLLAQAQSGAYA